MCAHVHKVVLQLSHPNNNSLRVIKNSFLWLKHFVGVKLQVQVLKMTMGRRELRQKFWFWGIMLFFKQIMTVLFYWKCYETVHVAALLNLAAPHWVRTNQDLTLTCRSTWLVVTQLKELHVVPHNKTLC